MKKSIYILFVLLLLVSCSKNNNGYDALEKSLIGILEKKDYGYIMKNLNESAKAGNEDVYGLAYTYLAENGTAFFNEYMKKSKGIAEYYEALRLQETNGDEARILDLLESAAKQGNIKAYYMIGNIYENKLEFTKAQEYLKKGRDAGEIYSLYSYEYNKNLTNFYKKIEELNKKLNDGNISTEEKKELGTLVLEKVSNYEKAYDILKDFLSENYSPALYAKAKLLEKDDKEEEAVQIYNQIFLQNKYYLAAFELASRLVKNEKNYDLALKVLDDTKSDEVLILGYKGFIFENLKDFTKAEDFYQKAASKNDIDSMNYLGRLYETKKEMKKAKDIYNRAYLLGSISAGYKLAYILEDEEKEKNPEKTEDGVKQSKEAKKILERLSNSGDDYSMVDLSLYYPETDKMVRILNLAAAAKLNTTAFYNLGVYYYNQKNKDKSKFYFRVAKENGYDIGEVFNAYITE
jgi:tetratricopeptide repeat protein